MKLSLCTSQDCGMQACSVDQELCMLHVEEDASDRRSSGRRKLVCLLTKHVDDLKITGDRKWMLWVLE